MDAHAQSGGVRPLPSGRRTVVVEEAEASYPLESKPVAKKRRATKGTAPTAASSGVRPIPTGRRASSAPQESASVPSRGRKTAASQGTPRKRPSLQPIPDESFREVDYQEIEQAIVEAESEAEEQVAPVGYYDESTTMQDNPWTESSGEVIYEDEDYSHHAATPMTRGNPWWFRTEYIAWWGNGIDLPPMLTTSPAGTGAARAGLLGDPGTQILLGNESYDDDPRSGIRFSFGYWLDPSHCRGIEAYFFQPGDESMSYANSSTNGLPILARPFFDASQQQYVAQLLSHPDVSNGSFDFDYSTETLGAGVLLRTNAARSFEHKVDFLGGYRYTHMSDDMLINDELTSTATGGSIPLGTVVSGFDDISTSNEYHGVDLGMQVDFKRGRWTFTFLGKCALGNMTQDIDINGSTTVSVPGATPVTTAGGLLTQPTNIGTYSRNKFTVVPEASINARYMLNCRWTATVGYNFIFWNNVVRADDQIDFRVNTTQIGGGTLFGPGQPEMEFKETNYWLQGVNAGLELQF
jgi:hypothetical protein